MRETVTFWDYKDRPTLIKTPKDGWWWNDDRGAQHCVISCRNFADFVYITTRGHAKIGYCEAHANQRITTTIITGKLEQGVWARPQNGKLVASWTYDRYIKFMMESSPVQAKKLQKKLKVFKEWVKVEFKNE